MGEPSGATIERVLFQITGVVQGVGFRPFIVGAARSLGLVGWVGNEASSVVGEAQGLRANLAALVEAFRESAPSGSSIESVRVSSVDLGNDSDFLIVASCSGDGSVMTTIAPDATICWDCLRDVRDPTNRRFRYPFTTCSQCGPRFSFTVAVPYDRVNTTMMDFPACSQCQSEYEDPRDRRFHAQAICCPLCGPTLSLRYAQSDRGELHGDVALRGTHELIEAGAIVAVKGIGGYHLACDASNLAAVERLRERKGRFNKPFAVMVASLEAALQLVDLSQPARELLTSRAGPIILAPPVDTALARLIAVAVAPGSGLLGVFLAPSALHHLLVESERTSSDALTPVLVMTSGNVAGEPICTTAFEAEERLAGVADAWLHHNRRIQIAVDDSVVRDGTSGLLPIRRSRGWAPLHISLAVDAPALLAVGGEIKSTICIAAGRRAVLSPHVGDASNIATLHHLGQKADALTTLFQISPEVVVADGHPGYLSRRWAEDRAHSTGAQFVAVQHHHAHFAALLIEHDVDPGRPVLGVTFDGTGYARDGTIWGGEFLLGSYHSVQRVAHLSPVQLPGGDAAVRRPARIALAHLHAAGLSWDLDLASAAAANDVERAVVRQMLASSVSCTPTTSMGRLFDAVSSLLGVCHDATYEGQAAIELEALAATHRDHQSGASKMDIGHDQDGMVLNCASLIGAAVRSLRSGWSPARAAFAFHVALANAVVEVARAVRADHGVSTVGLTGGVFQNDLLSFECAKRLTSAGFTVLTHRVVPANDGGLALGQVAVAASGGGEWFSCV